MRILLTGATGTLGSRLTPALGRIGDCLPLGFTSAPERGLRLDLTDPRATRELLAREEPDLIVHAAALTDVDACERDPDQAYRLNVLATKHLTDWAREAKPQMRFVYVSTDQVYDAPGDSGEDNARPVNVYALTKLWAEDLAGGLENGLILRTNFFGPGAGAKPTFLDWIVESCLAKREMTLFRDVLFNPLHVDHLVDLIVELIGRGARGVCNLGAAGGGLSKADFIRRVARHLALPTDGFREGSLDDVSLVARRPRDMRMSVTRVEGLLGRSPPSVAEGIARLSLGEARQRVG